MRAHHAMDALHFLSCFSRLLCFEILFQEASSLETNFFCKILQFFHSEDMYRSPFSFFLIYPLPFLLFHNFELQRILIVSFPFGFLQDLAVVVLLILIPLISPNSSKGGVILSCTSGFP